MLIVIEGNKVKEIYENKTIKLVIKLLHIKTNKQNTYSIKKLFNYKKLYNKKAKIFIFNL